MLCKNILEAIGHTPLVRLNRLTAGFEAEVYVKADFMNPGGSVKDRISTRMIDDAERRGLLKPGAQFVASHICPHWTPIHDEIARLHILTFTEPLSISRFAALAKLSAAVLCHDSGPMHVAAAVGTPVIALYGSQSKVLFPPTGEGHVLLQPPLPCTDCYWPKECDPANSYKNYCIRRIGEDEVFSAVRAVLAGK